MKVFSQSLHINIMFDITFILDVLNAIKLKILNKVGHKAIIFLSVVRVYTTAIISAELRDQTLIDGLFN